ncbi:Dpp4p [Dimargaris verticillata]|uniref:Dpp4p n=1 Tax=Dimargaris verticillata TaxID=2761393 RepID=A0A9W8B7P0_9FUNG|nr:Dpp4p [Dimargaris verticillata]
MSRSDRLGSYRLAATELEEGGVGGPLDNDLRSPSQSSQTTDYAAAGPQGATKPWFQRPVFKAVVVMGCLVSLFTLVGLLSKQPASLQVPSSGINADGSTPPMAHRVNPDGTETQLKPFTFETQQQGRLNARGARVDWVKRDDDPDDGYYLVKAGMSIKVKHITDPTKDRTLLVGSSLPAGFMYVEYQLSPDWKYVLLANDVQKVWRHSFTALYYVYDVETKSLKPLTTRYNDRLRYATWSPRGHNVAFVRQDNNLYVTDLRHELAVTNDGSDVVFNGILDWVYEEEIFSDFKSTWWSPDGQCLTFLRLDDSPVPLFTYPLYKPENKSQAYPEEMEVRYPKPGYPNPLASAFVFCPEFTPKVQSRLTQRPKRIELEAAFQPTDTIFTNFKWMTEGHDTLLVNVMNRVQDHSKLYLVHSESGKGSVVRERNEATSVGGDGAWVEIDQGLVYVAPSEAQGIKQPGYLDTLIRDDFYHIAYFDSLTAKEPTHWLTQGPWNVERQSLQWDPVNGYVYYLSREQSSIQTHLYRVKLDGSSKMALTPPDASSLTAQGLADRSNGTYEAHFSRSAHYYTLNYQGPDVPWFKIVSADDPKFEHVLEANSDLIDHRAEYALPTTHYTTITAEGVEMNVKEIRPPNFKESDKHAVLFHVYGGPNSQMVTSNYGLDWHHALVSQVEEKSLKFIVVVVDGRGSANRGRKFLTSVANNLGHYEIQDQINAAKHYQTKPYVDSTRLAIWGWSYGGYATAKVLEANSGVFKLGMSVAPVTHWNLYDSMYTERYMKTPQENPKGYDVSGVNNMEGFKKARFLLIHGTADDNVHFQQSTFLVNDLTMASVSSYQVQYYVDSNHRNNHNNAFNELYKRLKAFLFDNFKAS